MDRILRASALGVCALAFAATANATGNPAAGKSVFQSQCSVCHVTVAGKHSGIGPNLAGVVGRAAGALPGYSYSSAMKRAHFTWTTAQLQAYLAAPGTVVRGNKMPFGGLHNPQQLGDLVAYLNTLK